MRRLFTTIAPHAQHTLKNQQTRRMGFFSQAIAQGVANVADDMQHQRARVPISELNEELRELSVLLFDQKKVLSKQRAQEPLEPSSLLLDTSLFCASAVALMEIDSSMIGAALPAVGVLAYAKYSHNSTRQAKYLEQCKDHKEATVNTETDIQQTTDQIVQALMQLQESSGSACKDSASQNAHRNLSHLVEYGSEFEVSTYGDSELQIRAYMGLPSQLQSLMNR